MALTKVQGEGISGVSISANNEITMSSQPAFHATKSSDQDDLAVGGSLTTITFDGERFDQNSDFNTSTSTFTAPVTGKYYLKTGMYLQNIDSAANYIQFRINTSNKEYITIISPDNFTSDINYYSGTIDVFADMDASDTATVRITITGGAAQADVQANSSYTYFVGFLVC